VVVKFDEQTNTWWFRQSWLADALGCNERGRRSIVDHDQFISGGDAAAAGTAVHASVEPYLKTGKYLEAVPALAEAFAQDYAEHGVPTHDDELERLPIEYKSFTGPNELIDHAVRCAEAWVRDIAPEVEPGGLTEVPFQVPLFRRDNGVGVGIRGTVDYAPPIDSLLMDWKNKGREMGGRNRWKVQRNDIQTTVYCTAAVKGGLDSAWWEHHEQTGAMPPNYEWPMLFVFGNAIRGSSVARGELVPVMRGHGHQLWLEDKLNRFVDMAEVFGFERGWPTNETYDLCSEKWCPVWDTCMGQYITDQEHRWKPAD